ncbi:MAG: hypothetical protein R3C24_09655 [Cyanobacteriota/Melainabacteria group bacterium]|nr:hypothetical protein [Candidatus Obscuribacterales bacterium]HMO20383.1 hypothetical protein [Candidatus Melainabacteria bacterium]HMP51806.1 hypothetical protein [Candidatus Melainabacteria bacterium]
MAQLKLVEYKKKARETASLKELFTLFDTVSNYYELGYIDEAEFEEIKQVIWPNLKSITALKRQIDQAMKAG